MHGVDERASIREELIMAVNITAIKISSSGVWQGDNPLNFAFPLLIIQTILVLFLSRSLALLFKPLRQPKVIAEIVVSVHNIIFIMFVKIYI